MWSISKNIQIIGLKISQDTESIEKLEFYALDNKSPAESHSLTSINGSPGELKAYLDKMPNAEIVILYDNSNDHLEELLKQLLSNIEITKKPRLISIGDDRKYCYTLSDDILQKVSYVQYSENTDLVTIIDGIANNELNPNHSIDMTVLYGFIAVMGIAAVALTIAALAVLNTATLVSIGLGVAGFGATTALIGAGLFARDAYNRQRNSDEHSPMPNLS